jgi:hypothetical protein
MRGASGVLAVVLAETAAGTAAALWLSPLWGEVKRGFFILTGAVAFVCAVLAAASGNVASDPDGSLGFSILAVRGLVTAAVVLGLSVVALVLRYQVIGRVLGLFGVASSVATLWLLTYLAEPSPVVAFFQVLAGALFMGAVTVGLLLGHWYLTDRRLGREHIQRLSLLLIVAVVVEGVAIASGGFGELSAPAAGFSPFLSISGLASWLALGMAAATALIAVLIRASLRGTRARAVQAATGFFYLAVITAFTAETAAKIPFLA